MCVCVCALREPMYGLSTAARATAFAHFSSSNPNRTEELYSICVRHLCKRSNVSNWRGKQTNAAFCRCFTFTFLIEYVQLRLMNTDSLRVQLAKALLFCFRTPVESLLLSNKRQIIRSAKCSRLPRTFVVQVFRFITGHAIK